MEEKEQKSKMTGVEWIHYWTNENFDFDRFIHELSQKDSKEYSEIINEVWEMKFNKVLLFIKKLNVTQEQKNILEQILRSL